MWWWCGDTLSPVYETVPAESEEVSQCCARLRPKRQSLLSLLHLSLSFGVFERPIDSHHSVKQRAFSFFFNKYSFYPVMLLFCCCEMLVCWFYLHHMAFLHPKWLVGLNGDKEMH